DDLGAIAPGRVTLLESWGAPHAVEALVWNLLAGTVAAGRNAVVVDGGNRMNVYSFARAAEARGIDPAHALASVRVARGFTAYQFQTLVEDHLPRARDPNCGLVAALSFPDMYLDEDLPPAEGRVLARRAFEALRREAESRRAPAIVSVHGLPATRAAPTLRAILTDLADEIVGVAPMGANLRVTLPRRGVTALATAPGARQRTLAAYGVARDAAGEEGPTMHKVRPQSWMLGWTREGGRPAA
ncbi:MAG TPA: hypothetical protein VM889_12040, partial [Candidatus Thermoplasmatota archaeon]|nr:hypothetical protein [Candidatus Thermoplasmatota archaeon]